MLDETAMGGLATMPKLTLKTTWETIDRVLGSAGKAVLPQVLAHVVEVAAAHNWQIKTITLSYWQDEENASWESIIVAPKLAGPVEDPYTCLTQFLREMSLYRLSSPLQRYLKVGYGLTVAE